MVWVAVTALPHPSSAVNVRTMVYSASHWPGMISVLTVTSGSPQLSIAVAMSNTNSSVHSAV